MSDVGSDLDAAYEMIPQALRRLRAKNPRHIFIQFWLRMAEGNSVYSNFKRRFGKPGMSSNAYDTAFLYTNFLVEILIELGEVKRHKPDPPPLKRDPSSTLFDGMAEGEFEEMIVRSEQNDSCRESLEKFAPPHTPDNRRAHRLCIGSYPPSQAWLDEQEALAIEEENILIAQIFGVTEYPA